MVKYPTLEEDLINLQKAVNTPLSDIVCYKNQTVKEILEKDMNMVLYLTRVMGQKKLNKMIDDVTKTGQIYAEIDEITQGIIIHITNVYGSEKLKKIIDNIVEYSKTEYKTEKRKVLMVEDIQDLEKELERVTEEFKKKRTIFESEVSYDMMDIMETIRYLKDSTVIEN